MRSTSAGGDGGGAEKSTPAGAERVAKLRALVPRLSDGDETTEIEAYVAGVNKAFGPPPHLYDEDADAPTVHKWLRHFTQNLGKFVVDGAVTETVRMFPSAGQLQARP